MNSANKLLFKTIPYLFILVQASLALQAPYLISATSQGDSAVQLVWRNNDAATLGFIIQRKDSNATAFGVIDSVAPATELSYLDTIRIRPTTLYTYRVLAYNATSVSDTSNSLQATTMAQIAIFKKPGLSVSWNSDTTNFARVVIYDSSNSETGYRIYRADGFSAPYTLVSQIVSASPTRTDSIVWLDSTLTLNSWLNYKVAAYTSKDSLFSDPCSTYSFHSEQIQQPVTFTKLSDFPISMDSGLSALAGDSIIIKESLSPAGKYSAINITDPAHPKFDGYVDSTALLSYPVKTMLPVFLKYGVFNNESNRKVCLYNEKMLVLKDSVLKRYQIQNNNLVLIDSLKNFKGNSILLMDTTLLAVQYDSAYQNPYLSGYMFYPVQVSPAGLSQLPNYKIGEEAFYFSSTSYVEPNICGALNNRIFISANRNISGSYISTTKTDVIVYDIPLGRVIDLSGVSSYVRTVNTGCRISAAENLSTAITNGFYKTKATELLVSDVGNLHSYEFASSHNGLYRDTIHTKDQLRNILLDTSSKKVYLVYSTNLTVLSYQRSGVGAIHASNREHLTDGLVIRSGTVGTTIVLPDKCTNAALFIYDVSGRIVETMRNITSNAIIFRPKSKSTNFYVAVVKSTGMQYSAKFVTK
jgi:hypothetical protein